MVNLKKWIPFKRGDNVPGRRSSDSNEDPMTRIQREINDVFSRMERATGEGWMSRPSWELEESFFGDFSPANFSPSIDLSEEGNHLRVTAELPGMDADDVDVVVKDDRLRIHGEKGVEESQGEQGFYRTERSWGSFTRTVPLPTKIDDSRAEATFDKGVLNIRLPKVEEDEHEEGTRIDVTTE